jgi:chromate transport protein ChrA
VNLPPRADQPTTYVSVPPPSAVPVVSIQPASEGGPHVLSLMPGAKIVAPALPRAAWRKLTDAAVAIVGLLVIAWLAAKSPAQVPALIGLAGLILGYYFRTRKPRAELTAGAGGASLAPSEPPPSSTATGGGP